MLSRTNRRGALLAGVAMAAVISTAAAAQTGPVNFDIASGNLGDALGVYAKQSGVELFYQSRTVQGRNTQGLHGAYAPRDALDQLLKGTGLVLAMDQSGAMMVREASAPQSGSAAGDGADGTVQALIVTAQKREENIQDVPIAMSAFTQEDLTRSQVAGGPDLMTQVPNMTFTKTNFTSYSIQLRGIGTQAISATVDPAVAVAFNNTPFVRNRFFEQEFYDLQRVEVLRGPQGTLYGRNATAGVVNLISAKPKFTYEARLSADVGNYGSTRLEGMVNVPLVDDVAALRIAGAWTKRDGYAVNELSGKPIDGRDLWSTRVSLRLSPNDRLDANLIWEHFEENDDRIRSGKQLCKTDNVTEVGGIPVTDFYQPLRNTGQDSAWVTVQGSLSQGCLPASLYSPDSFQKTNALALPYYIPLGAVFLPVPNQPGTFLPQDPYASRTQSHDLRVIEAQVDPTYRAKSDVAELQVSYDLSDTLTLSSETAWASDFVFSTQDYNRFAGAPHAWDTNPNSGTVASYISRGILSTDGFFCDPQIGCSDRLTAMDLSTATSSHFSQELRLASNFDGPFNFSLGGNFLRYDTEDKYYVFINSITMISAYLINGLSVQPNVPWIPNGTDNRECLLNGLAPPDYSKVQPILSCTYIDPNPVTSLNDMGHNYFLSRNPYKLISYAMFGEAYYQIADNLKVTAGLRWTVDKKEAPRIPSWITASGTAGHPVIEVVDQEWRKPTGRLAVDWKPDLSFTDDTMIYASYAHGYKAGGMNPPPYGKTMYAVDLNADVSDALARSSALQPKTFDPEYVDAFELGAKNTLLDGKLTLNLASFYYNYQGYQLSQIVNRSAVTLNFDSKIWGLELESDWRPVENLRLGLKFGYEKTKVADGMQAIDVMDRTAGNPLWHVSKPFPTVPANCILPTWLFLGTDSRTPGNPDLVDLGGKGGGNPGGCEQAYLLTNDPATSAPYVFDPYTVDPGAKGAAFRTGVNYAGWSTHREDYPCLPAGADPETMTSYPGVDPECLAALSNNGEGLYKNLSGKELPNAPHMTATLTADYTVPLPSNWMMTLHTDLYYQSEAWTRIFNTEGYDKLKAYSNINLAAIFTNEDAGWKVMAYVKNVLDRDSITGAFLNSDDSGLTTNVFLTEPRLYGLRVTKEWNGGPWWTGGNPSSKGPFPLTVELGGQVQRQDAPYASVAPDFVSAFPAALDPTAPQHRDLDWGDGREVRVEYRPGGSWNIAAGLRYGRTNTSTQLHADQVAGPERCRFLQDGYFSWACSPDTNPYFSAGIIVTGRDWSDSSARDKEEHLLVDFAVGKDVGLGLLDPDHSRVSAGLRYAQLKSTTAVAMEGIPNWAIPDGFLKYNSTHDHYRADLKADREFTGAGPTISWDAAAPLLGSSDAGLFFDWSVTGGALFGKQKTAITGQVGQAHFDGKYQNSAGYPDVFSRPQPVMMPVGIEPRSKSVTVPVVDLSAGLSYQNSRIKVGAGYRWEKYFNVLDVGYDEHKDADRTIDGPYFKIAVGFGG